MLTSVLGIDASSLEARHDLRLCPGLQPAFRHLAGVQKFHTIPSRSCDTIFGKAQTLVAVKEKSGFGL
jgi:hypothetical protein